MDAYLRRLPGNLRKRGSFRAGEIEIVSAPAAGPATGVLYEDRYVLLVKDAVRFPPRGRSGTYIRIINRSELLGLSGVVIVPVWQGRVIFVEVFRHATRSFEWELPRGFQEPGLSERDNARAEAQQETGRRVLRLRKIGHVKPNAALMSTALTTYSAEMGSALRGEGAEPTGDVIREVREVPLGKVDDFIRRAPVTCGITLGALMQARLKGVI